MTELDSENGFPGNAEKQHAHHCVDMIETKFEGDFVDSTTFFQGSSAEEEVDVGATATEMPTTLEKQNLGEGSSSESAPTLSSSFEVVIPIQRSEASLTKQQAETISADETMLRSASTFSTDSLAECCRICQQYGDEPLIEIGCHCRGELGKAHRPCIQRWFGNKGSNKCEVCQHVAENIPAPPPLPAQHFWVWRRRVPGRSRVNILRRRSDGGRFHPLWAALLILIAGLLFDVLISVFLGASALPVNIIIGVLVVLGVGTAARLVVECWHERSVRRSIRRMESNLAQLTQESNSSNNVVQLQPTSTFYST